MCCCLSMDMYRMGRMGGSCVRTVLWMEGWMGVEELTTHDEQLISSSSLDVGVGIHSEDWNQKSMAKRKLWCTILRREDVLVLADVLLW